MYVQLTNQVFCRRQIGESRRQKKYSQIDFEVRNRDFGKFSEWIGILTVQLVGFTTHDIIGRPPWIIAAPHNCNRAFIFGGLFL